MVRIEVHLEEGPIEVLETDSDPVSALRWLARVIEERGKREEDYGKDS